MAKIKKAQVREAVLVYKRRAIKEVRDAYDAKRGALKRKKLESIPDIDAFHKAFCTLKTKVSEADSVGIAIQYGAFSHLKSAPVLLKKEDFLFYLSGNVAWWTDNVFAEMEHVYKAELREIEDEYQKIEAFLKSIKSTNRCVEELTKLGFDLSDLAPEVPTTLTIVDIDKDKLRLLDSAK
ncbi:TPA: hypothetical protein ACKPC6_002332 [Listeria monocytogenes]|uniref:hypothetical protein n=1 Tax=Listeria TaxID=1637 RepID=UPI0001EBBA34|nr:MULTISPECIES: hypothetical protein [Listeria]EAD2808767.1 hypothetical protein [Listeria monocytogenes]EAE5681886.1 hypothetical protein [Listeria monocytogenes]EAE6958649.1 hypothetical protein [Listeria monocytogenes]EAE9815979.1 hypothetical protein [Listeria monocytogenes]EAF4600101.1 hypothetical protein [Listeria monocytogenes]